MSAVIRRALHNPRFVAPSLLLGWEPFPGMEELCGAVPRRGAPSVPAFLPRFDVKEGRDGFVFKADVPGLKQEDVEITLDGNRLTITGKREAEAHGEGETHFLSERSYGAFTRSFTLPESADTDRLQADLSNGVLTLQVPKRPETRPRRIPLSQAPQPPKAST